MPARPGLSTMATDKRQATPVNRRRLGVHSFYEREGMRQTHYGYTTDL